MCLTAVVQGLDNINKIQRFIFLSLGKLMLRTLAAVAVALFCASCTPGPIVKSEQSPRGIEGRTDGAIIGYYFPKAVWRVTVSFDKDAGTLSLKADPKPTILPDTDVPMHWLSYSHAAMSDDDIDIQVDGSMLTLVTSKSSDQTVKIVEAANQLLTQVGTTRQALEKVPFAAGTPDTRTPGPWEKFGCTGNLSSEMIVDLTNIRSTARRHDLVDPDLRAPPGPPRRQTLLARLTPNCASPRLSLSGGYYRLLAVFFVWP